jgi:hypothetical protein
VQTFETEGYKMPFLRKLEMGCGIATGILGIATAANMLSADFEAMRRLERDFSVAQAVPVVFVMYVLPALLVAIGTYLHASRRRMWGLPLVLIACLWLVIILLLWLSSPFFGASGFAWLNLSLAALATLTAILSLAVRFSDR